MHVTLDADAQKFVEDQVKAGHFGSPAEVLVEAIHRMMVEVELAIDDETAAAITRAEEQIDRGEGIEFEELAEAWRAKLGGR